MRRRRRRRRTVEKRDPEFVYPDDQETGVAERIDGKAQLDDTQVVTPVHEMRDRRSDEESKPVEPVYELVGSQGPAQELAAGPLGNRHEAEGDEVLPPLNNVSPFSGKQQGAEDYQVSPVSNPLEVKDSAPSQAESAQDGK